MTATRQPATLTVLPADVVAGTPRPSTRRVDDADQRPPAGAAGRGIAASGRGLPVHATTRCGRRSCGVGTRASESALADAAERADWRFHVVVDGRRTGSEHRSRPRTLPRTTVARAAPAGHRRLTVDLAAFAQARGPSWTSPAGCSPRPPPRRASSAASGCTSGRWCSSRTTASVGTRHWPLRLGQARHRRGRPGAPDPVHPLRRLPVLHPAGPAAQPAAAGPRLPGAAGTARLPARRRWTSTSGPTS